MSYDSPVMFNQLGLSAPVIKALESLGYETPTPIQEQSIPPLLEGHDLLGQAQTGTGKTAAFALPLLSRIDIAVKPPQILVLAPTRELAIQVAEAFQQYARFIKGFHVLPIYGGSGYDSQLRQLKRGAHVIVGTPGRIMDHMRRGTLKLDKLSQVVLDEADEMLRMGFIDDVEWILEHAPDNVQTALFSATMPSVIKKVANQYLNKPIEIKIASKTTTATTIQQRYWQVSHHHKLDTLTRVLEAEEYDAVIVFVRTKTATVDLAERLNARGYSAAALNGDIAQKQREITVNKYKKGTLDILIATDVAARGLDVTRISHVINYDIPYDAETYTHRIGRTGRAGRTGQAILFITPKETRLLSQIQRTTGQKVEKYEMPTVQFINEMRINRFKDQIRETLTSKDLDFYADLVRSYQQQEDCDPVMIAAAVASMLQGDEPFLLTENQRRTKSNDRQERGDRQSRSERGDRSPRSSGPARLKDFPDVEMLRFRIDVGYQHDVKPGNIVGAIANEAEIESQYIGQIEIFDDYSLVDLPAGMPKEVQQVLRNARVCGRKLNLAEFDGSNQSTSRPSRPQKPRGDKPKRNKSGKRKPRS